MMNRASQHLADMQRLDITNFFEAIRKLVGILDGTSGAFIEYLAHDCTTWLRRALVGRATRVMAASPSSDVNAQP